MSSYTHLSHCSRRLEVGLRVPELNTSAICYTREIGMDGLSIEGAPSLRCGQGVQLVFDDQHGRSVSVDCVVEPYAGSGLRLRYCNLQQERRERLEEIVWPSWDGANLLEGLVLMAGRFGAATLQDWLRLTSLLNRVQPRMASRRRSCA